MFFCRNYMFCQIYHKRCFWAILIVVAVLLFTQGSDGALIFNGKTAEAGAFPFAVSIQLSLPGHPRVHTCTASLITTETCLSAAHCLYLFDKTIDKNKFCGVVGSLYQTSNSPCKDIAKYEHPKEYNPNTVDTEYDIAVFIFKTPVQVGPKLKTIALARPQYDVPLNTQVNIIGWGWTDPKTPIASTALRFTTIPVAEHSVCKKDGHTPTKGHICIDGGTSGSCVGDSGGPVVLLKSEVQVGVISSSTRNCSEKPFLAVDVRIRHQWIVDNSKGVIKFI